MSVNEKDREEGLPPACSRCGDPIKVGVCENCLTAEPEPSNCPLYAATCSGHYDECPHADELRKEPSEDYEAWLKTQADGPWNTNKDDSGNYTDYSTALVFRGFLAAKQSAYRRIQEMQAEVERLRSTLYTEEECQKIYEQGFIDCYKLGVATADDVMSGKICFPIFPDKNSRILRSDISTHPDKGVSIHQCDHCGYITCDTDCDGSSHYTPDEKE